MIKFLAHHFMCALAFQGYGYSINFVENYKKLASQIANDSSIKIKVVDHTDDICNACPNQTKQGQCINQAKVFQLDSRHRGVLKIKVGDVLTWNEAVKKIKEKMSIEKLEYACQGCVWQPYGICKNALLKAHSESLSLIHGHCSFTSGRIKGVTIPVTSLESGS